MDMLRNRVHECVSGVVVVLQYNSSHVQHNYFATLKTVVRYSIPDLHSTHFVASPHWWWVGHGASSWTDAGKIAASHTSGTRNCKATSKCMVLISPALRPHDTGLGI